VVHGERAAAPHIVSLGFAGVPAEPLLHALEARSVYVSAGSACAAKDKKPSPSLRAIGVADDVGTLRVSFARTSTEREVDRFGDALAEALAELGVR
jgi:cysteine desulfurase